ncbi:MAG: hypothetical protein JO317_03395 [Verrucomicrobiae bacterium]|nr:hypothetical protein [Verrucomicrobiae bacterium]
MFRGLSGRLAVTVSAIAIAIFMTAVGSPARAGTMEDLKAQVDQLTQTVKDLQQQVADLKSGGASTNSTPTSVSVATTNAAPTQTAAFLGDNPSAGAETPLNTTSSGGSILEQAPAGVPQTTGLTAPLRLAGTDQAYVNLSFDGLFAATASSAPDVENVETGGHDPNQRGFTVQNLELVLDGAVDPYFKGQANIVMHLDRNGDTQVEAEEAWMETTSLPWNLQVKGGLFLSPFGRLNPTHPHTWEFADQPLVNGRFLGPDGLRNPGAQISYLLPTDWYSELILAIQNGSGDTAYSFRNRGENDVFFERPTADRRLRGFQDLLFIPRWANSIDLDDENTIVAGASGAFGPNDTGGDTRTDIYGADLFYKWKPSNAAGGWPFVKWQTEAMFRRFEAGEGQLDSNGDGVVDVTLPREQLEDWGWYSQVAYGFTQNWVAGLRVDYLDSDDSAFTQDRTREDRWRVSPNVTWYPTEFSKIRLQYNHDWISGGMGVRGRDVDTVILQFEFALGAHGAHKF